MYDEPARVDALGKHRVNPKVILRIRRLIFSPANNQDGSAGISHALETQARDKATQAWNLLCGSSQYTTQPAPKPSGLAH